MEIVGAWLATVTAMPPVVTKSYEIDLPLGRACHKRIAYANPWNATRLFRLASSNPEILRPRYESLEVKLADRQLADLLPQMIGRVRSHVVVLQAPARRNGSSEVGWRGSPEGTGQPLRSASEL